MSFAVAVILLQGTFALLVALTLAAAVALGAPVPPRTLGARLAAINGFVLLLAVTLPFSVQGEPVASIAGLAASREGLHQALLIALRANAIALMLSGLLAGMDAVRLAQALQGLAMPSKLVQLMLFTIRYLEVLGREQERLRTAMRARAFVLRANRHGLKSLGYLLGMLLVRSLERAGRVHEAMRCRGFSGQLCLPLDPPRGSRDRRFLLLALGCVVCLLLLDQLIGAPAAWPH